MTTELPKEQRLAIIREALRHTELHIFGLAEIADNADKRAATLSLAAIAYATLLIAFSEFSNAAKPVIVLAALLSLVSAVFSLFATVPKKFHIAGHRWRDWQGHIDDGDDIETVLISQAKENDDRIDFNFAVVDEAAKKFKRALWVFSLSIAIVGCAELWFFISGLIGEM
ncbi:MAG: hypothetical protein JJU07_03135 [Natronohydrobacter sp.]|nr:hypothetical protein [Natronohydrobacter sp.]